MSRFWIYAVVIALIITAIVEQCHNHQSFSPVLEHSEIKGSYIKKVSFKEVWDYRNGDAVGYLVPYMDSVFVDE